MVALPLLDRLPYTLQSLPYGVISTAAAPTPRCAVAIGEHAIDLARYAASGAFGDIHDAGKAVDFPAIFAEPALNTFAALPWSTRKAVRARIQKDLQDEKIAEDVFVSLADVQPHLPMRIGGFSDFYTSLDHCKNCSGELTTTGIADNWWHAPSVYNSRVSSLVPTPSSIRRPRNVYYTAGLNSTPAYGPSQMLDFELEMGFFVSKPVPLGETMAIADAREHIFGFVMLNDWSARLFEMRPLGPFHSKGFGTSLSNWIVPLEALAPFACPPHLTQDPPPFEHLTWPEPTDAALDIKLRITLVRAGQAHVLGASNLKYLYWTPYQQLTHHAASGCGMRTGDLIGTGTISGSGTDAQGRMTELGCLYEAQQTKTPVLPPGQGPYKPGFLEDGDEIIMEGWCEDADGKAVLGFGQCRGRIAPPK